MRILKKSVMTVTVAMSFSAAAGAASFPVNRVFCAGLTYEAHIKATGEKVDRNNPLFFEKKLHAAYRAGEDASVAIPGEKEIYAELGRVEPGIEPKLQETFSTFPKMLDYEGELGIYFTRDFSLEEVSNPNLKSLKKSLALFVANDLTLRSVQVLGDKSPNKINFWSASKSFPRFLPMSTPVIAQDFPLDSWPDYRVQVWVDEELRQNASVTDIIYTPRQFFIGLAHRLGGTIPAGSVLITGTPTGTAFTVSPSKRFFAGLLGLDRIQKLKSASKSAAKSDQFLEEGSHVKIKISGVGTLNFKISDE
jgi:2-keto-4-pentenoate hydratase/2-oxohepta-3-ene-1,7-dioic acid hydratase in catechol pathway